MADARPREYDRNHPQPHPSDGEAARNEDDYWQSHPLYYSRPLPEAALTQSSKGHNSPTYALTHSQVLEPDQVLSEALTQDEDLSLSIYSQSSAQESESGIKSSTVSIRDDGVATIPDSTVEITDGRKRSKDDPRSKPLGRRGTRTRSILDEFSAGDNPPSSGRPEIESARNKKDQEVRRVTSGRTSKRNVESRYPLLQSTVEGLATDSRPLDTSVFSASSTSSQFSPTDTTGELSRSVEEDYVGHGTTSPVDLPEFSRSVSFGPFRVGSTRSLSHYIGRDGSIRRSKQRNSIRSNSYTSLSPASTFLAQWKNENGGHGPEPDEEGQEIGDHSGYIIGRQIGFGGFSVVKEVFTFQEGVRVSQAVKIVRKQLPGKDDQLNDKVQSEFEHEVLIWRYLKHPCVLPLVAVYDTPFATYCITPLNPGGTLYDLVRSQRRANSSGVASKRISTDASRRYIFQLASALRYLHEDVGIVHRDIKLENCLLDTSKPHHGNILLCDFGMADFIQREDRNESDAVYLSSALGSNDDELHNIGPSATSTNVAGSLQYASPELIEALSPAFEPTADMWSFGVLCYALLTGDLPFNHGFAPKLQQMILDGQWDRATLRAAGPDAAEMTSSCLAMDPQSRWTVSNVLQCKFLDGQQRLYDKEFGGEAEAATMN